MPAGDWYDVQTIHDVWADAPDDAETCELLIEVAQHDVIEFAPVLPEDAAIPAHYRLAQVMQAKNLWEAGRVSPSGTTGEGDFVFTPYPLDRTIKQILRPKSPRKAFVL